MTEYRLKLKVFCRTFYALLYIGPAKKAFVWNTSTQLRFNIQHNPKRHKVNGRSKRLNCGGVFVRVLKVMKGSEKT